MAFLKKSVKSTFLVLEIESSRDFHILATLVVLVKIPNKEPLHFTLKVTQQEVLETTAVTRIHSFRTLVPRKIPSVPPSKQESRNSKTQRSVSDASLVRQKIVTISVSFWRGHRVKVTSPLLEFSAE